MIEKIIKYIIASFVFIVPLASIIPVNGTIVWFPQLICFIALGFILLALNLWSFNKLISILLIYLTYSYIFISNVHPRALLCLICVFIGCYISYFVSRQKNLKIFYNAIALMACLQLIYVIMQSFNIDPFFSSLIGDKRDLVGVLGSRNQSGIFGAFVAPLLIGFNVICPLIGILIVYFSKTTSAMAAIIVSLLAVLYLNKKYVLFGYLTIFIVIAIGAWNGFDNNVVPSFNERFKIWELTVNQSVSGKAIQNFNDGQSNIIKSNPITGFGIGSFMVISPTTQGDILKNVKHRYENAHNDFIQCLFEFGYIGLILVILILLDILKKLKSLTNVSKGVIITFSSLLAFGISSLGVYVFYAPVSYFMCMLVYGLFNAEVKNASKSV